MPWQQHKGVVYDGRPLGNAAAGSILWRRGIALAFGNNILVGHNNLSIFTRPFAVTAHAVIGVAAHLLWLDSKVFLGEKCGNDEKIFPRIRQVLSLRPVQA